MKKKKIVVIGAGPGGLAAAMQLGFAGADVTVLEANRSSGVVVRRSKLAIIALTLVLPSISIREFSRRFSSRWDMTSIESSR
jgi:NADPH-dependent 2,4-dienoyl-CoA reductase/sulfur reductase-like enzyme